MEKSWNYVFEFLWEPCCMLGKFSCILLSAADFFQIIFFKKKYIRKTIRVSNNLDPDQDRHYVFFLFLNQNICCWYSKELSQCDSSF